MARCRLGLILSFVVVILALKLPSPSNADQAKLSEQAESELSELIQATSSAYNNKRYLTALKLGKKAHQLALDTLGETHPDTLSAATQLADIYQFFERYDEAERLFEEILKHRRAVLGERDTETVKTRYNLADTYKQQGQYTKAAPLFEKTVEIVREDYGENKDPTVIAKSSLAETYRKLGRDGDAEKLYRQILQSRRETLGNRHEKTMDSLRELSWLYQDLNRYADRQLILEDIVQIESEKLGERHPDTLNTMSDLADVYWRRGRLGKAEVFYRKVLETRKNVLGPHHENTLASMHNLALIYDEQGLYDQAEPIYRETLALKRKILGARHPDTLVTLNNLGVLLRGRGRYRESEKVAKESLELHREVLGDRHPKTLRAMNNLGVIYQRRGRYGQAGDLYEDVLKHRIDVLGEEHPDTLASLHDLANIYIRHTRYADAFPLYERAFKLRSEILGPRHPYTLGSQLGVINALLTNKRVDQAIEQLQQTADDRLAYAEAELATTEGAAARNLLLNRQGHFQDVVFSLALRFKRPETLALASKIMLQWKQVQGAEAAFVAHLVRTNDDPAIKDLGEEILALRTRLAKVSQETDPREDPVQVLEELEAKEHILARISGAFKRRQTIRRASVEQLQNVLPPKSAVVEFRQFTPVNDQGGPLGPSRFVALLVRPDAPPILKNAGEVKTVERLLDILRHEPVPARAEEAAADLKAQLFSAFGDDVDNLEKIYIAPDGILNLVPFDRLRLADGRYWGEGQTLHILQAGRDLLQQPTSSSKAKGLLALGGVDFDGKATHTPVSLASNRSTSPSDQEAAARGEVSSVFEAFLPLQGSAEEVTSIERVFRARRPNEQITVWRGNQASEARLKTLDGLKNPPRVLHVATHGFYLGNHVQKLLRRQLYSGLVLSGANRGLIGEDVDGEDGILFSLEAESLNLEGTELVVLSACDTGKGVIDYSEGVVGMTKALRIAGAQQVLMTLWPISDSATAVFMETFYDLWLAKPDRTPASALAAAKDIFRNHENQLYRNPTIWAPFVLIGPPSGDAPRR